MPCGWLLLAFAGLWLVSSALSRVCDLLDLPYFAVWNSDEGWVLKWRRPSDRA